VKLSLYLCENYDALAWAMKLRVNPGVIWIQENWGSCSSAGTVTLAADLIGEDERFQDYITHSRARGLECGK